MAADISCLGLTITSEAYNYSLLFGVLWIVAQQIEVRLLVASTGALFSTLFGYLSSVNSVAFSPDGLQIASRDRKEALDATLMSSMSEAISSLDGPASLVISHQKDINPELPIRIFTTSIDEFVRVWRVSTGGSMWRPNFRILCAADVILDDVASLSSNYKKALMQRNAIDNSSSTME
ncbi:hypothetical protein K457DRAFT_1820612 [Linnemannia elongata AG-77]|uniref:WD40 repeat-like protein n=1 Tax=Linnemannia elongata AG-77 TaxID=1314771 RepID=A0A197JSM7_9FUNG|nr:hypothetical protein K457DRAFT_1820612 [Linnemannia elongata AG-77]